MVPKKLNRNTLYIKKAVESQAKATSCLKTFRTQRHPTDRLGKLSVRKALNPLQFSKGNFTTNFRDMGNLRPGVFVLIKMWDLRFSGNGQKCPSNFEKTQVPLE